MARSTPLPARHSSPITHHSLLSVWPMVARRLWANGRLALAWAVGLVVAVALVTGVPLFAEATSTAGLRRALASPAPDSTLPRSALLVSYVPGRGASALTGDRHGQLSQVVRRQLASALGLPERLAVRFGRTEQLPLVPANRLSGRGFETYGSLAFVGGLEQHAQVVEGRWPRPGPELEAVLSTDGLDELGIAVGDTVQVITQGLGGAPALAVRVVGRWHADRPEDPFWFNQVESYRLALLVPEESFFAGVITAAPRALREAAWYGLYDPSSVRAGDAERMLAGLDDLRIGLQQQPRGLKLDVAPDELLESFRHRTFFLQILLFVLAAPLLLIVLQFVAIASGMLVDRQRGEIALLKSRGATTTQVLAIYACEGLLLSAIGLALGPPLGAAVAALIGQSAGFLTFGGQEWLPVEPGPTTLLYAAAALALGLVASILPATGAARHSIVSHKQEVARTIRPPFSQRYFLDLAPAPVAAYAYLLLGQRRSVLPVGEAGDVFSDPLLLLAPALFILAASLVALRIFPLVLRGLERISSALLGVSLVVALRQIARQPGAASGLVLLTGMTVALGAFSASAAATIDRNYADAAAYRVGADLRLSETGVYDEETETWTFFPASEHLQVPGVRAVARVFRTTASERLGARATDLTLLSVDPGELASVAHWRSDYAARPLEDLMVDLASDEAAILLDRRLVERYRLQSGDQVTLSFKQQQVDFVLAGAVEYYPTLFPDDGVFAIANLDYVFGYLGEQPHDVWLRLAPGAPASAVVEGVQARDIPVVRFEELNRLLAEQRRDPTRAGVLGLLSVGFLVAALLTVLSLLLYSYLSFRHRLQQFGVLRAIGLSFGQLTGTFLAEQAIVVAIGVAAGTAIGVAASQLFIPFLQIKAQKHAGVPPFIPGTAWDDLLRLYLVLGVFLMVALPASLWLLGRLRIHEAIKFGEERG